MMAHGFLTELLETAAEKVYDEREAAAIARLIAEKRYGLSRHDIDFEFLHEVEEGDDLNAILDDLEAARPVQYILGVADFDDMELAVGEGVLIPRPETEELVRWIAGDEKGAKTILDACTGSGAIAIALARRLPQTRVTAIDVSPEALKYAQRNNEQQGTEVAMLQADILDPGLELGTFDVIVSNPPYIPASERAAMADNVVKYEPAEALFVPDDDPLLFYRAIAKFARRTLSPGGALYFEIHENAAESVIELLAAEGFGRAEVRSDINSKPRMVRATCTK